MTAVMVNNFSNHLFHLADEYLKIPIVGFTESFNISVSAALLLQNITSRLRKSDDISWQLSEQEVIDLKIDWSIKTIQNGERIAEKYLLENS